MLRVDPAAVVVFVKASEAAMSKAPDHGPWDVVALYRRAISARLPSPSSQTKRRAARTAKRQVALNSRPYRMICDDTLHDMPSWDRRWLLLAYRPPLRGGRNRIAGNRQKGGAMLVEGALSVTVVPIPALTIPVQ